MIEWKMLENGIHLLIVNENKIALIPSKVKGGQYFVGLKAFPDFVFETISETLPLEQAQYLAERYASRFVDSRAPLDDKHRNLLQWLGIAIPKSCTYEHAKKLIQQHQDKVEDRK
jgi:hypothetical protein